MKPAGRSEPDAIQALPPGGTLVIVNPKAGAGKALRAARTLAERLEAEGRPAQLAQTEQPGHATLIARHACAEGVGTVVAVGGDGTVQEVVTGLCLDMDGTAAGPDRPRPMLALLPAGTGGDYRRTFGWTESADAALSRICSPRPVRVDIGRAEVTTATGKVTLAFANVLSFGLGGLTDQLVSRSPKWIGGTAAFYLGAVRATLIYQALPVVLEVDGNEVEVAPYANVAVCLGRYFGGGMKIAPDADPSDGMFEIVTIQGSRASVLALTADIYRGAHLRRAGVRVLRGKSVVARVTRPGDVLVDADGEQPGTLPISVELLPRALTLLT
jgi:YegS/Rv2252/BmrU family lipid kinase